MAEYLIQDTTLTAIADAIRTKSEKSDAIVVSNMATEILNIPVSGESLNYSVVGGTSQPSNPSQYMIWIPTDIEITNCIVSPIEPTSLSDGIVWIRNNGNPDVSFNALTTAELIVSPAEVYQYQSGTLNRLNGWIYIETSWIQFAEYWDGYYFKDGDQCESVTGGWSSDGWSNTGTAEITNTLVVSATNNYTGRLGTNNSIDLTNINTIKFNSPKGNDGKPYSGYLCVTTEKAIGSSVRVASAQIRNAGEGSIDVSNITGNHYLFMYAMGGSSGSAYADIDRIWTE